MLQSRHIPPPHSSVAAHRSTLLTMGTVTVSSPRFVNISTLGFGCMRLPEYQLEEGSWQVDQEKIQYAASKGLGVVVMGPVGGRRLAAPTNLGEKLRPERSGEEHLERLRQQRKGARRDQRRLRQLRLLRAQVPAAPEGPRAAQEGRGHAGRAVKHIPVRIPKAAPRRGERPLLHHFPKCLSISAMSARPCRASSLAISMTVSAMAWSP